MKNKTWFNLVFEVFQKYKGIWEGIIASFVYTGLTSPSLIQWWQGNIEFGSIKWLVFCNIFLWGCCVYIWFKKKSTPTYHGPTYSKGRYFFLAFTIIITILTASVWVHFQNVLSKQIIVLVANFDDNQNNNLHITNNIIKQLKNATSKYPDVKIQALDQVINEQKGGSEVARSEGEKRKASIVLWGWYSATKPTADVNVYFEILKKQHNLVLGDEKRDLQQDIAELETSKGKFQISNPINSLILLTTGLIRYQAKDYDEAINRFSDAIAQLENQPQQKDILASIYFWQGNVRRDQKNNEKAIADYTKAINFNPKFATAYNNRGGTYLELDNKQKAIDDFTEAIEIDGKLVEAYNNRGIAYSDLDDKQKAINDFNKAIQIDRRYRNAYNNRGVAYSDLGNKRKAIDDFNEAIKIDSKYATAYNNRGLAYSDLDNKQKAIDDFNEAIKIDSKYAIAYNNRGLAYSRLGNKQKAIDDLNKAIEVDPKCAIAYNSRGSILYAQGKIKEALKDYSQAIEIDHKNAPFYTNRGVIYTFQRKFKEAINDHNQALKINPKFIAAYNNRGSTYFEQGNLKQAINDFTDIIKKAPQNDPILATAYYSRGIARASQNDKLGAIADFTKSLEINPHSPDTYFNLGQARFLSGDKQKGIADLEQAAKLYLEQGNKTEYEKVKDQIKLFGK